ncbi:MAG: hypothetical protein JWR50_752 [Mucilaginibacter sp.]|nr:hypothetical protein [Mucilaginibacter sp.]
MRVHFFSRINSDYQAAFRSYNTIQNLRTVKTVSLIYFLLNISLRFIVTLYHIPIQNISHYDEFNNANIISSLITPVFYLAGILLIKQYERNKPQAYLSQFLVLLFALFIMISCMRVTFFVMHNPRNTLVMYFMGTIIAGMFFTFEYFETLVLAALAGAFFAMALPYYQTGTTEIIMNNFASFVLLTVFYCMSRFSFSYRADNFLKLRAIEEKNIEIETASRLKNEILGIVAHDLRNPLTAIMALSSIMQDDDSINEDNQENLQMIRTSCAKATAIINDLIETANNENDSAFDIAEIELNQYLLKIVEEWSRSKLGQVEILYYGTEYPIFTHINVEKMQRVMDNLISNAIKFSGESERIEISLRDTNGQIFIDVRDFGMGIPEHLLPFIFDRFSKASRKGIRGEESVGLGLSIVKQIVEKHGGKIDVISTEKQGTTFTIHMTRVKNNMERQS